MWELEQVNMRMSSDYSNSCIKISLDSLQIKEKHEHIYKRRKEDTMEV